MASAFLARRCFARMDLALAVHLKGFGFWFRCSIHSSIAVLSSVTSLKVPRRMRWRVISAKSRSTRLSQEQDVGVKCSVKRLCRANMRSGGRMLAARVEQTNQQTRARHGARTVGYTPMILAAGFNGTAGIMSAAECRRKTIGRLGGGGECEDTLGRSNVTASRETRLAANGKDRLFFTGPTTVGDFDL